MRRTYTSRQKKSVMNVRLAERTFPVIISTHNAQLFDAEIQTVLGFFVLAKYISIREYFKALNAQENVRN